MCTREACPLQRLPEPPYGVSKSYCETVLDGRERDLVWVNATIPVPCRTAQRCSEVYTAGSGASHTHLLNAGRIYLPHLQRHTPAVRIELRRVHALNARDAALILPAMLDSDRILKHISALG